MNKGFEVSKASELFFLNILPLTVYGIGIPLPNEKIRHGRYPWGTPGFGAMFRKIGV
jgi:hypothetical protein